jgi:hypothetical protein
MSGLYLLNSHVSDDVSLLSVRIMKYNCGVMIIAISRGKRVWGMIRISVQVSSGTARFRVAVQAESIERALKSVARQYPDRECEVTFPIDPETFFVEDSVASVKQLAA